ncbi:hypothetical protein ABK249_22875 [Neorhizobium sp. Rsf11]|uniref:Uncharacterized protein n=1 Tax=Neorhizobium phenanthreniclasticum TaxID=3157917 RepID=A0ABV0M7A5_9HYPH
MKVTNNSKAMQGVQTLHGVRYVKPGETKELAMTAAQVDRANRLGFLSLEGDPAEDQRPVVSGAVPDGADGVYLPASEFNAMREAFEELRAENTELRKKLADGSKDEDGPKGPFEVKETSPGWYGAFDAKGEQVGNKMRADDAEAFKAMSQAEQEQLLAK